MLTRITEQQKDYLLQELLSNGRGSLDSATRLLQAQEDSDPKPPMKEGGPPDWCICADFRNLSISYGSK